MPRALAFETVLVQAADRPSFLHRLRQRREHYKRANCNFWVFEHALEQWAGERGTAVPSEFTVFTEAADDEALRQARRGDPDGASGALPVLREVDLSTDR